MARLEIAVTNQEEARAAEAGGAGSIEISANLAVGGLTPPLDIVEAVLQSVKIDVHVIVRPHADSFHYSPGDVDTVLKDTESLAGLGIKSIVFGAWDQARRIDLNLLKRVRDAAAPAQVTLHRALDQSLEPERTLESLAAMGVRRVLTAGPANSVWEARADLARWIRRYGPQLSFVVSGGLKLEQLPDLTPLLSAPEYHFGAAARSGGMVDAKKVRRLCSALSD